MLIDRFLESAIEVDVDRHQGFNRGGAHRRGDGSTSEEAGVHLSGDSACVLPPRSLAPDVVDQLCDYAAKNRR